ncbi:LSM domain [Carpediemonas membranifera]|uniref:LSM domain n=1 Tax=Carpediemonas membranifera TaxID=201153 RepID=A0A8J6ARZ3_9EUKA|nr:LSM domain [Carpediemonas membranifera]|eukprot:KAG9392548.1 LSM domain [Carpediemonas membranifera]
MLQSDCASNFASYVDKTVLIKCSGDREISGVVKSFDDLSNVILQDADELSFSWKTEEEVASFLKSAVEQLDTNMKKMSALNINPVPKDLDDFLRVSVEEANRDMATLQDNVMAGIGPAVRLQERFQSLERTMNRAEAVLPLLDALIILSDTGRIAVAEEITEANLGHIVEIIATTYDANERLGDIDHPDVSAEAWTTVSARRDNVRAHIIGALEKRLELKPTDLSVPVQTLIRHLTSLHFEEDAVRVARQVIAARLSIDVDKTAGREKLIEQLGGFLKNAVNMYRVTLGPLAKVLGAEASTRVVESIDDIVIGIVIEVNDSIFPKAPSVTIRGAGPEDLKRADLEQTIARAFVNDVTAFLEARGKVVGKSAYPIVDRLRRLAMTVGTSCVVRESSLLSQRADYLLREVGSTVTRGVFDLTSDLVYFSQVGVSRARVLCCGNLALVKPVVDVVSDRMASCMTHLATPKENEPIKHHRSVYVNSLALAVAGMEELQDEVTRLESQSSSFEAIVDPLKAIVQDLRSKLHAELDSLGNKYISSRIVPIVETLASQCVEDRSDAANNVTGKVEAAFADLNPGAHGILKEPVFVMLLSRAISPEQAGQSLVSVIRDIVFPPRRDVRYSRMGALRLLSGVQSITAQWTTLAKKTCVTEFSDLINDLFVLTVDSDSQSTAVPLARARMIRSKYRV